MDSDESDQQVYVLLSVFRRKYQFSGQQNISLMNSITGKVTGAEAILLPTSITFQLIDII